MKKITQEEIAARLGLSRATVSRVLRNVTGPRSKTAARIIETARELGYRLPATASTASRKGVGRSQTAVLGLFLCIPDEQSAFSKEVPMRTLHGATDAARERNALLHVEYVPQGEAARMVEQTDLPIAFRKGAVRGILLTGQLLPQTVSLLMRRRTCVRMNVHDLGIHIDAVGQDDRMAVQDLVTLLMEAGHRKFGYYCVRPSASYALSRFAGYVEALAGKGLEYNPAWSACIWQRGISMEECVKRAMDDGVTAWICANDGVAFQMVDYLHAQGIRVPEDISVCGFDRLPVPRGMKTVTTIDWPFEDMAAAGVAMLMHRINEPARAVSQLQFSGRLIEGGTTGPVRGG